MWQARLHARVRNGGADAGAEPRLGDALPLDLAFADRTIVVVRNLELVFAFDKNKCQMYQIAYRTCVREILNQLIWTVS